MLLVVGWDGACAELVDGVRSAGRMPVLDRLLARGRAWRVRSTIPAVTFPAWTTFLTAAAPDHHGITDFAIPRPGSYGVRFVNATHRRLPTIVAAMAAAGVRAGLYGVPATFPAEGRGVFEICGFDTPLGATAGAGATLPGDLAARVRRRHGRLGIEGIPQARITAGWHDDARRRLLADIDLRSRIAIELMQEHALDVFIVHFMESDTAAHHFWQFDDPGSPRHRDGARGTIADVYSALDRALGRLLDAAGPESDVLLLSDHGSAGASDRAVCWNRWLADRGLLGFHKRQPGALAAAVKRGALAWIPPAWQARAFAAAGRFTDRIESGSRFAGIDWSRTRVFSDELPYFPSLRVNLVGREPRGTVPAAERDALLADVGGQLLEMRDPFDGGSVVERVRRREELFDGPFAERYPDLILELRRPGGYAYAAVASRGGAERRAMRRLGAGEITGAKGSATGGVHSDFGLAVLARASALPAAGAASSWGECSLMDLGATVLALAGVRAPAWVQGRSLVEVATGDERNVRGIDPACALPANVDYAEDEEREVAQRLRDLGYLP